jgi:hypothetical protein
MSYANITNPANFQLQDFAQFGFRVITTDFIPVPGEQYRTLYVLQDAVVTATTQKGDDITSKAILAGTLLHGLFNSVSITSGRVLAYAAGRVTAEEIIALYEAYVVALGGTLENTQCAIDAINEEGVDLFADASLVMIPEGYGTGVVYGQRPLTSDSQLTFTRASTATRVGPDGLIEKVRTNLLLQSETFDNASWVKNAATVTANTTANPLNGALTADTITLDAGTAQKFLAQSLTQNGLFTQSAYLKAGTHQFVQFLVGGDVSRFAAFDLVNGTSSVTGGVATITAVANGFYRCTFTFTTAIGANMTIIAVDSLAAPRADSTASTGTFIAFGCQLETGDIATDYIPTTTAAVSVGPVANLPRIDYTGGGCGKLLLEPQRTNLYNYSEQLNQWTAFNATVTANDSVSPDGYTNADRVQFTAGGLLYVSGTGSAGENTLSVYAKATNGTSAKFRFFGNGNTIYSSDQTATGEWQRFTFTYTYSASSAGLKVATTGADDVIFYGFQHEIGAYATSYIPTLGSTVTRLADSCYKTGIASLIGQTEGTIFLEFDNRFLTSYPNEYAFQIIGSGGHQLWMRKESGGNQFTARLIVSSSTIWTSGSIPVPNGITKIAISYKTGDSATYLNGTQFGSTNTAAFSGSSFTDFYFNLSGTANPELIVSQALIFPTRLSNEQLQTLTSL